FYNVISEEIVKNHTNIIADEGYLDVGYRYINLDDAWQNSSRVDGKLVSIFPNGIKALSDYVHSKGLLFGIYSSAGNLTCLARPGSLNFETIDAETFVEWGVDYLKYDNCHSDGSPEQERYQRMRDALTLATKGNKTQIYYSICEWGKSNPWLWAPGVGNSWRISADIQRVWPSIVAIIDSQARLTQYGGPGGWNDPDMLIVGFDAITFDEQVTHFAFWAALKAPLILGCDLAKISGDIKKLVTNIDIISVNQDPLGKSVSQVYHEDTNTSSFDIWTGPLSDGCVAILFNRGISPINITLNFKNHCRLTGNIMIRDLVKQTNIRNSTTD
ncbi:31644_t:CDS:10, partial [Racocetra persica]